MKINRLGLMEHSANATPAKKSFSPRVKNKASARPANMRLSSWPCNSAVIRGMEQHIARAASPRFFHSITNSAAAKPISIRHAIKAVDELRCASQMVAAAYQGGRKNIRNESVAWYSWIWSVL